VNASTAIPKSRMTVPQFLDWAVAQAPGRYELVAGTPVAMAPERNLHLLAKGAVFRALSEAVAMAGLDCTVLPDGATVVIDDETAREPDAAVQCGSLPDPDALTIDAPVIVVEVASPTSMRTDEDIKLVEYFSLPSIQHYLVLHPKRRAVVHHSRQGSGEIHTRILHDGAVDLTPPGFSVSVEALLGPALWTRGGGP
jgi:Uma2 family endonuclease